MTRDEILNLEAGETIDNLVAEKVMGWHIVEDKFHWRSWEDAEGHYQHGASDYDGFEDDEDFNLLKWHPSESVLWAIDYVIQHFINTSRKRPKIDRVAENEWRVQIDDWDDDTAAYSESLPLAICRSALLVIMKETNASSA